MKRLLPSLIVAAALLVPGAAGQSSSPRGLAGSGEVVVYDTWYGLSFQRNYTTCDAVADIEVRGEYDVQKSPGGLSIALGLTNKGQSVQVIVDGLHRGCFGKPVRPRP